MPVITDSLCEAVGRITLDPAMLALFLHDRDKAIEELRLDLSVGELEYLEKYVSLITSGSTHAQEVIDTVLRAADRTVQQ